MAQYGYSYSIQDEGSAQTLLLSPSARATSLGEAFTAVEDDVAGSHYNPATVTSLKVPQASLLYQKQFEQESYGHFMLGAARHGIGGAISVGYFDVGSIEIYNDSGFSEVNGQRDLSVKAIGGRKWNSVSFGVAGTFFRSTLVESKTATAWAGDAGFTFDVSKHWRLGASLQNMGTKLKYNIENEALPQLLRFGGSYLTTAKGIPILILLGTTGNSSDHTQEYSGGVETNFGPIALRLGGKKRKDFTSTSLGAGINIGSWSFDYNLDLIKEFNAEQKFSLKYRFEPRIEKSAAQPSNPGPVATPATTKPFDTTQNNRVYTVQPGDTWEGLADRFLKDSKRVDDLKRMNQHLGNLSIDPEPGQKIILP